MHNEVLTLLGQLGLVALLGLVGALMFRETFSARWFGVALSLYVINDVLLTRGLWVFPELLPDAQWNWEGKALALTVTLAIATLPPFGWKRVGLTLSQGERPLASYLTIALLSLLFFGLAALDGDGPGDFETIAFQWTMPGFEEEIFYRGTLLLAFNEAFGRKVNILGAPLGFGGVLATLLFGFAHSLSFGDAGYAFEMPAFIMTSVPAFLLLWIREQTGSLVLPIVGHNIANGASTLL